MQPPRRALLNVCHQPAGVTLIRRSIRVIAPEAMMGTLPFLIVEGAVAPAHAVVPAHVRDAIMHYARAHKLSPVETMVVEAIAMSVPRMAVIAQRDITENTYKTHVRHILRKTGESAVTGVRLQVMEQAAQRLSRA